MAAGDLTDLAAVKAWLGLPPGAGASDDLMSALITAASDLITSFLGRNINPTSYTEVQDGNGATYMLLRQAPITAVQSVAFCGQILTASGDPAARTPGFIFDDRRLSLIGYRFPHGDPVVVTYTAGFSLLPPAVVQAATELVGEAFRRRDRIGQTSKSLGGQETVAFSSADMNAAVKAMLAGYRAVAPV